MSHQNEWECVALPGPFPVVQQAARADYLTLKSLGQQGIGVLDVFVHSAKRGQIEVGGIHAGDGGEADKPLQMPRQLHIIFSHVNSSHVPHDDAPPSMGRCAPVMKSEAGQARKTTAPAISLGCPMRPMGREARTSFMRSEFCRETFARLVSVKPGQTQLT